MAASDHEPSQSLSKGQSSSPMPLKVRGVILIEDSQILISLAVSLIMIDGAIESDGLECCFLPTCHNVPAYASPSKVVQGREPFR